MRLQQGLLAGISCRKEVRGEPAAVKGEPGSASCAGLVSGLRDDRIHHWPASDHRLVTSHPSGAVTGITIRDLV
jgi:hypothetical protein